MDMDESGDSSVSVAICSSTPNKRICLEQSMDLSPILSHYQSFLSDCSNEVVSVSSTDTGNSAIFLSSSGSSDSSGASAIFLPDESCNITDSTEDPLDTSQELTATQEQELTKVAKVLISSCCNQECLLNLTANDVLKFRT